MAIRPERTGRRDLTYSKEHRKWGNELLCLDIDFCEHYKGIPVALIETKNQRAAKEDFSNITYQALVNLGNLANLPVFNVRYNDDVTLLEVTPLNQRALDFIPRTMKLNQKQYIRFLYFIRGIKLKK